MVITPRVQISNGRFYCCSGFGLVPTDSVKVNLLQLKKMKGGGGGGLRQENRLRRWLGFVAVGPT